MLNVLVLGFLDFPGAVLSERPCLVVYLRIRVKINVNEDQEKDARKVVFGCFEMCFGHAASMRSPIKSTKRRALILEWL